jgi:hypothetical protein
MRRIIITDEELRAKHAEHVSWRTVANDLGCAASTVRLRAKALGLVTARRYSLARPAMTPAEARRHDRDCRRIVEILEAGGLQNVARVWG